MDLFGESEQGLDALESEEPDLGPAPTTPNWRRAERLWRFEWPDPGPLLAGHCAGCDGEHVPDREVLDGLLRAYASDQPLFPCTCDCCAVTVYL
jgi:hypothetical protein